MFASIHKIPHNKSILVPTSDAVAVIGQTLAQEYKGKVLAGQEDLPQDCAPPNVSKEELSCTFWLWEKPGSDAGVKITFKSQADGTYVFAGTEVVTRRKPARSAGS